MRIVGEYFAKAAAFDALAAVEPDRVRREHYANQATYYRSLAQERRWKLAAKALEGRKPAA